MTILFVSVLSSDFHRLWPLFMTLCWHHQGGWESGAFSAICVFFMLTVRVPELHG